MFVRHGFITLFALVSGLYCTISREVIVCCSVYSLLVGIHLEMACPLDSYFHAVFTIVVLLTHSFQPHKNFLPLLLFSVRLKIFPNPLSLTSSLLSAVAATLSSPPLCLLSLPSLSSSYSFNSNSHSPSTKKAQTPYLP